MTPEQSAGLAIRAEHLARTFTAEADAPLSALGSVQAQCTRARRTIT